MSRAQPAGLGLLQQTGIAVARNLLAAARKAQTNLAGIGLSPHGQWTEAFRLQTAPGVAPPAARLIDETTRAAYQQVRARQRNQLFGRQAATRLGTEGSAHLEAGVARSQRLQLFCKGLLPPRRRT